jgi:hypothetical protein
MTAADDEGLAVVGHQRCDSIPHSVGKQRLEWSCREQQQQKKTKTGELQKHPKHRSGHKDTKISLMKHKPTFIGRLPAKYSEERERRSLSDSDSCVSATATAASAATPARLSMLLSTIAPAPLTPANTLSLT